MTNPIPISALASGSGYEAEKATRPMRWWYESLADFMIANPSATQSEAAAHLGRAVTTISLVVNTDSFKAYFRQRRNAHAEQLDAVVRQKLFRVAETSLDSLLTSLDKKRDSIPIEMLHRTTDMALKNLGYGAPPPSGTQVTVNTNPQTVNVAVSLADLEAARAALRRNQISAPSPTLVDAGESDDDPPALAGYTASDSGEAVQARGGDHSIDLPARAGNIAPSSDDQLDLPLDPDKEANGV